MIRALLLATLALGLPAAAPKAGPARPKGRVGQVNPFIGTGGHGHTFPGATAPYGGVQLSPDTRRDPGDWDGCSGYHHDDGRIFGFSHTHLSGTGASDYCDILFAPQAGELRLEPGSATTPGYGSAFDHASEVAWPGYYAVTLKEPGIRAELTATPRVGLHRYTFPAGKTARLLLDLIHRDKVLGASLRLRGDREVEGTRRSGSWAKDQRLHFVARFSRPFRNPGLVLDGQAVKGGRIEGRRVQGHLDFGEDGGPLLVKVGLSAVSVEGARKNLEAEAPGWDFDAARRATERAWAKELGRIEVQGGTPDQQTTFYTALYHCMIAPNLYQDADGRYLGRDLKVHRAQPGTHYTVFSLWDTFRALHPLLTLVDPARTRDFIRTFIRQYEDGGRLPVWELSAQETDCMIGYHAVPVIAEAILKGIGGFDREKAFQAMKHSAEEDRLGLKAYKALGFVPADQEHESVSKTLEYAYDDWCIAQVAGRLGHAADRDRYLRRAQAYRHLYDPSTGFFRARMEGHWWQPFEPSEVNANYTEANAWQYAFCVPQDVSGLMALMGGPEAFATRLDALFAADSKLKGNQLVDLTGAIGQYIHGNEPSHHMAYLYSFAGQPWKTQAMVRRLMDEMYRNAPDGLAGNEDCGQMSAWFVLSALGFYSVTPGADAYVLGTPLFPRATLHLGKGRTFTIEAPGTGAGTPYIQGATLGGRPLTRSFLTHGDLQAAGRLVLRMGPAPSAAWGVGPGNAPVAAIREALILPVPFVAAGEARFDEATEVRLGSAEPGVELRYTLDGTAPGPQSPRVAEAFRLDRSARLRAVAFKAGFPPSGELQATFTRLPPGRRVTLSARYSPQYSAGGDQALVDGLRGAASWRLGRWQGYQGQDLEAVVDLGSPRPLHRAAMGFIQDQRSWILMPKEVAFAVSLDGKAWEGVGRVAGTTPEAEEAVVARDYAVAFPPRAARYLRVRVTTYGPLPAGHPGAGNPAFFFADEIVAE